MNSTLYVYRVFFEKGDTMIEASRAMAARIIAELKFPECGKVKKVQFLFVKKPLKRS